MRVVLGIILAAGAVAAPGLPVDAPAPGPCTLHLRLVDDAGGPVESEVDLWRLDAPGDGDWHAGDQLCARVRVPLDGVTLRGLPEGVYAVRAMAERFDAPGPPPFTVTGAHTAHAATLELPRRHPVHLEVLAPVTSGRVRLPRRRYLTTLRDRRPPWIRERRARRGARGIGGGGAGAAYS